MLSNFKNYYNAVFAVFINTEIIVLVKEYPNRSRELAIVLTGLAVVLFYCIMVLIAAMKYHDQNAIRERRVIQLILSHYCSLPRKSGQEHK